MPDNSDDESGAEDAPLLARAATIASKSDNDIEDLISSPEALNNLRTRSLASFCFKGLPWVVALVVIEVIIVRAESAVQFPYLRSLQRCVRPVVPAAIHGHEGWSGSVHCLDRSAVARMAQAESNYVQGIGQLVHTAWGDMKSRIISLDTRVIAAGYAYIDAPKGALRLALLRPGGYPARR